MPLQAWMFVLCVLQSGQKAKRGTMKTKKQVRMMYRVQENKKKPTSMLLNSI